MQDIIKEKYLYMVVTDQRFVNPKYYAYISLPKFLFFCLNKILGIKKIPNMFVKDILVKRLLINKSLDKFPKIRIIKSFKK